MSGLTGCARFDPNDHPLIATLGAFWPFSSTDVSGQAKKIQYATLDLTRNGRGGLLVLAQQSAGTTYWQSSQFETIVLSRGYLDSTGGLANNLAMTHLDELSPEPDGATPFVGKLAGATRRYTVTRSWQNQTTGQLTTQTADATLSCAPSTEHVKLPLATLPLLRCAEHLDWRDGGTSQGAYWIDPKDNRIWKAQVEAWPGGDTFAWQIARPWW